MPQALAILALTLTAQLSHPGRDWRTLDECAECDCWGGLQTHSDDMQVEERESPRSDIWSLYIYPDPGWSVYMVFMVFDANSWCRETRVNGGRIAKGTWRYKIGDFDNCEREMGTPVKVKIRVWYIKYSSPDCRYEPD